ncbi:MAG: DUF4250 domain-containing protein [Clostridiales bacterium]|nr:DUF4250 domain-containing protein [Clostridiales bacterium]MCD8333196.1 DUF4250 domain-containing protein [Clostridiales bacterium]
MDLPRDPIMLLSVVNTQLRDRYPSLAELAADHGVNEAEITEKLRGAGYVYDSEQNQFI